MTEYIYKGQPRSLFGETCEAYVECGLQSDSCGRPAVAWATDSDKEFHPWPVCDIHR